MAWRPRSLPARRTCFLEQVRRGREGRCCRKHGLVWSAGSSAPHPSGFCCIRIATYSCFTPAAALWIALFIFALLDGVRHRYENARARCVARTFACCSRRGGPLPEPRCVCSSLPTLLASMTDASIHYLRVFEI